MIDESECEAALAFEFGFGAAAVRTIANKEAKLLFAGGGGQFGQDEVQGKRGARFTDADQFAAPGGIKVVGTASIDMRRNERGNAFAPEFGEKVAEECFGGRVGGYNFAGFLNDEYGVAGGSDDVLSGRERRNCWPAAERAGNYGPDGQHGEQADGQAAKGNLQGRQGGGFGRCGGGGRRRESQRERQMGGALTAGGTWFGKQHSKVFACHASERPEWAAMPSRGSRTNEIGKKVIGCDSTERGGVACHNKRDGGKEWENRSRYVRLASGMWS